jgi:hypothetical protein
MSLIELLKAFGAGFLSTLVFHQGLVAVLYVAGITQRAPYSLASTVPLGVPQVVSLAFWGGVWGIGLWMVIRRVRSPAWYWIVALVFGAVLPSLVAWFVVFPLKGQITALNISAVLVAFLLNGAWGLGVALFMRLRNV